MSQDLWGAEEYDAEARRLYDRGEFEEALEVLWEGIRVHPDSRDLHLSLGYTQLALEEYGWARGAFETVLDEDPDHEEALVGLGDALLKLGERARAFLAFERVLELGFGDEPGLMLTVARALYREELYRRAARFYRLAEGAPEAAAELGYTLYQLGERQAALRQLADALDREPEHHEARAFFGNLLYEEGKYEEALDHFLRIPPTEVWDPLAAWRTVELLRSYRGRTAEDSELAAYLERLDELSAEPAPEEKLLAELEASRSSREEGWDADRHQLDLFALGVRAPRGRDPEIHTVRARDGRVYTGDWLTIVAALRDHSADPDVSIAQFMRKTARLVQDLTGIDVPEDDPEGFLKASARAGLLRIER